MAERGRPTDYKPEFVEQVRKLAALGATDVEVADFFEVDVRTIYRWKHSHEEFCQALNAGKEKADERVVHSLYQKAVGYTFESEKIFNHQGGILRASTLEHVAPDTTAAIFWLKNRKPEEWRDKQVQVHEDPEGKPADTGSRELAKAIGFILSKGLKSSGGD